MISLPYVFFPLSWNIYAIDNYIDQPEHSLKFLVSHQ